MQCVCTCVMTGMYMWRSACVHPCGGQINTGRLPLSLSMLESYDRVSLSLNITDSARLAGQRRLASQLLCRHWWSELRFSCLHSKSFTHWAISPAPSCIFYKRIKLKGINSEGYLHHNIHPDLAKSVLFSLNPWGNQAVRICKGYLKIEARVVILKRSEQPRPMGE